MDFVRDRLSGNKGRIKMKRNKFNIHVLTHDGKILDRKEEGISYQMKNLLNGRESVTDYQTDDMYKVQLEAMREWIIKMRW